ncbi:L,D-transpeptidase [Paenibacillus sp. MMS20-IR301]|uniref:L,D-transpeptidase n=1 Tax=Paenibacillus sp. MMS20-IR301 TaxID=2895946 RepID=UPI0028ECE418|nr:L,D-transpeptidase [Paenibacillus sp. MMS20-IR301]WNS46147.1 L,D-transpeptidase [Paenibacillus sp. MMS20-IR301]
MKNTQHLKAYVQMHPDNKMAWYLLGKEYYKNGQQGKANYCFNQAGEVYEAFEHSKVPAEMLKQYEDGLLQSARERQAGRLRKRRILLAFLLLFLLLIPAAVAPELTQDSLAGLTSNSASALPEAPPGNAAEETAAPDEPAGLAFTAAGTDAVSGSQGLAGILQSAQTPSATAMLGMKRSGKWLIWTKGLPLAATIEKSREGRVTYQSYNPAACDCQPPDAEGIKQQAASWQEQQEELAVLWSAVRTYKNSKGALPKSLEQLVQPFPANWLGAVTPLMKEEFAPLRSAAAGLGLPAPQGTAAPAAGASGQGQTGTGIPAAVNGAGGGGQPFFTGPLTIIIDKQKHRLALTSGSIILRNYEVGLGGERTPEGNFVISDKVVNPNGRDNGEFGSRGMQLSDSNYAIHGTNDQDSIGKDESLGCIRMNRKDVEELFAMAPMGTKVQISKGVLPEELVIPDDRFPDDTSPNQTNPHKVYHWLN